MNSKIDYFTEEQYQMMLMSKEEARNIADDFLSNNMKGLRRIMASLIHKKSLPKSFDDDLKSLACMVFTQSIYTYDPKSNATFKTFLWGNIWRKFWTYERDVTRPSRCAWEPIIDEETKWYKCDENGEIILQPVFDISIYSKWNGDKKEDKELWEYIEVDDSVEDEVIENEEPEPEYSNSIHDFLENISRDARKVALYILDGYTKETIIECKGITAEQYNNAIQEFGMLDNLHILIQGGQCNAKN